MNEPFRHRDIFWCVLAFSGTDCSSQISHSFTLLVSHLSWGLTHRCMCYNKIGGFICLTCKYNIHIHIEWIISRKSIIYFVWWPKPIHYPMWINTYSANRHAAKTRSLVANGWWNHPFGVTVFGPVLWNQWVTCMCVCVCVERIERLRCHIMFRPNVMTSALTTRFLYTCLMR